MTNTIINYINYITTIIVNQEYIIQAGISFFRLPVRMPLIVTQTVRETIAAGLVCAAALLLLWYMALDLYRSYQALCEQRSCNRQQPPVSILRCPGGLSHRKKNQSWFDPEEEEEQDNFSDIESSLDAGLIDDGIDSAEDPLEDTIIDDNIPVPPPEESDNAATIDIPSDGMGSGWTESGKRYSLRRAKLLIPHAEDTFTEALGSGMTEQGRRYSRRVANRRNCAI
ncbi:unnamed protein product [Cylindrotheca closterium]|uniref:Uncharacterized protein n=1 Tax=Cylindrotheca closterium TaxID=2856 RepID=A0AAD2PXA5_9STRA|nr:unnamed protein product [Cylindrotheca closterium]